VAAEAERPVPKPVKPVKPRFFPSGAAFRAWLERHHARPRGLLVGLYRKASGRGGLTYPEALDAALCFGWIDGPRRGLDETAYTIHFSPRRPGSIWSRVNLGHVKRLTRAGLMAPAGIAALKRRDPARTGVYAFEQPPARLRASELAQFRSGPEAWAFFQAQPPGWRRTITFWVVSPRRPETRAFRLQALIDHSARQERVSLLKLPSLPKG
jgi:uncharacterized protein YdeI (YjbR/CyaY-like superfamily)